MDFIQQRLIRKIERLKKKRKEIAEKILIAMQMKDGNSGRIERLQDLHTFLNDRIKKRELQLKRKDRK